MGLLEQLSGAGYFSPSFTVQQPPCGLLGGLFGIPQQQQPYYGYGLGQAMAAMSEQQQRALIARQFEYDARMRALLRPQPKRKKVESKEVSITEIARKQISEAVGAVRKASKFLPKP